MTRLADRLIDRVEVERRQRTQVDDLEADSVLGGSVGGLQARLDHRPVRDQRRVGAFADDARLVQRERLTLEVDLALVPVATLGLHEHDRVVAGNGLLDHPVGVVGVGARHDLETGGQRELRLGALGVVLDRADATAERDADDDRHLDLAVAAEVQLGDLADDLVVRGVDEAVELDLEHGTVATHRQADRGAEDALLGQRAVDDTALAEVLLQSVGDAEDATELGRRPRP